MSDAQLESAFQKRLIDKLENLYPGCFILKNDASYVQGVPDLVIFYRDRWAFLEVKASATSKTRPNQPYWVRKLNDMSYAAFIFPENQEEILHDLERVLG